MKRLHAVMLAKRHGMTGLGLVELMIALVLGLIVVGAAFAIFHSNQITFRANEDLGRMQEGIRVAVELMAQDVRAAGSSACSSGSTIETTDASSLLFRDNAISGDENALRLVYGTESAIPVISATNSQVTLDIDDATDVFEPGNVLLLCNPHKSFMVVASTVSEKTVTFPPLADAYDLSRYPHSVMLARFRDVEWFVDDNERLGSSLFVSRGGGPREEVVDGVQSIGFAYLERDATDYVAVPGNWRNVISVRMQMVAKGRDVEEVEFSRSASSVTSLRGRTL